MKWLFYGREIPAWGHFACFEAVTMPEHFSRMYNFKVETLHFACVAVCSLGNVFERLCSNFGKLAGAAIAANMAAPLAV